MHQRERFLCIGALICLISCNNSTHSSSNGSLATDTAGYSKRKNSPAEIKPKQIHKEQHDSLSPLQLKYTKKQLLTFLDSVGHGTFTNLVDSLTSFLNLSDTVKYPTDSAQSIESLNITLSESDYKALQKACKTGAIAVKLAKIIFPKLEITKDKYKTKDSVYLNFTSFDKNVNDFKEFEVEVGRQNTFEGMFYFFNKTKLIARHYCYYRNDYDLRSFTDEHKNTVIYYKVCFDEGSDAWWFQYYFFKYIGGKLIPVLNTIAETNLNLWGLPRTYSMHGKIISTNPLKIKMVYSASLSIENVSFNLQYGPILQDSTIISYTWDYKKTKYIPAYNSKLNNQQIASFYLSKQSDLFFLNSYYSLFKKMIRSRNDTLQRAAYMYLDAVKNELNKN